ncbi:hypothetical protein M3Y98_00000700 [Aphelenchoides besseyi]|nr:hypothetical protein M3Y98_00000700 [Aphelenchoides besseyi]KAI6198428.1 hypothetical protein M3Y96_00518300 [Aphelenchoides besseyi]
MHVLCLNSVPIIGFKANATDKKTALKATEWLPLETSKKMKLLILLLIALSAEGYRLRRIIPVSEFNHSSKYICTTPAPTESPFRQCAAEVCGNYTSCGRSCDDCPAEYGFCIVNTCCVSSCQPHSAADSCKEPPTAESIRLTKQNTREECKNDSECGDEKFCRQQSTGMFCGN